MSQQSSCVECDEVFDTDEMIQYEGEFVCGDCKDLFFQKIKEGVDSPSDFEFKGFWIRFVAVFLDGIITQILSTASMFVLGTAIAGAIASGSSEEQAALTATIIGGIIGLLIGIGYEVFLIGKYGSTFGKMACNIKIVRADGSPVGYGLATGRYFAKMLSGLIAGIGYFMAAFDPEKRALHDRICDTRAIARH